MMVNTKLLFQDHGILFRSRNIKLDFVCTTSGAHSPGTSDVREYYLASNNGYVELWLSIDEQDFYENCWAIVAKQKISQLYDKKNYG